MQIDEKTPEFYRVEEIAKFFSLTTRRIQQLTQDGILPTSEVVENGRKCRRYEFLPTVQRYIQYLSEKAYGKRGRSDKELELKQQKLEADIALKESQGELHRLKTAIAAGEYIAIDEVKLDYSKFFLTFKKFVMSLPARVCGMVAGQLDPVESRRIEKEISAEMASLLDSFVVAAVVEPRDVKGIIKEHAEKKTVEEEISND